MVGRISLIFQTENLNIIYFDLIRSFALRFKLCFQTLSFDFVNICNLW